MTAAAIGLTPGAIVHTLIRPPGVAGSASPAGHASSVYSPSGPPSVTPPRRSIAGVWGEYALVPVYRALRSSELLGELATKGVAGALDALMELATVFEHPDSVSALFKVIRRKPSLITPSHVRRLIAHAHLREVAARRADLRQEVLHRAFELAFAPVAVGYDYDAAQDAWADGRTSLWRGMNDVIISERDIDTAGRFDLAGALSLLEWLAGESPDLFNPAHILLLIDLIYLYEDPLHLAAARSLQHLGRDSDAQLNLANLQRKLDAGESLRIPGHEKYFWELLAKMREPA